MHLTWKLQLGLPRISKFLGSRNLTSAAAATAQEAAKNSHLDRDQSSSAEQQNGRVGGDNTGVSSPDKMTTDSAELIHELERSLDEFVADTQKVLTSFTDSGANFIKLADLFQVVHTEINANQMSCKKLVETESGQLAGENIMMVAIGLSREGLAGIEKELAELENSILNLQAMEDCLQTVRRNESLLESAIAPFSTLRVLFKIHSAPLSAEQRLVFGALAEELEKLDQSVRKVFSEQFSNLNLVRRTLLHLLPRLQKNRSEAVRKLSEHQKETSTTLNLVEGNILANQSLTHALDELSRELQPQLALILIGTQFHDIIRQRLEHIHLIAVEMKNDVARVRVSSSIEERQSLSSFLSVALEIEQKLMESAVQRTIESENSIRTGLQGMVVTSEKIFREEIKIKQRSDQGSGIKETIRGVVGLLHSLEKELLNARDKSIETLRDITPLSGMVTDLTGYLSTISMDIKLISLNAQVKAAHINEGTGLDVLSAKNCEMSTQILELNDQLATDLRKLTGIIAESCAALTERSREIEVFSQTLAAENQKTVQRLQDLQEANANSFVVIEETNQKVETASQQILDQLEFKEKLLAGTDGFWDLLKRLKVLVETPVPVRPISPETRKRLDELKKNYTMKDEYLVHDQVVDPGSPPTVSIDPPQSDVGSPSGDIEFF